MRPFHEFFAGGGMARCGLGPEWDCLFANDFDERKCASPLRPQPGGIRVARGKCGRGTHTISPEMAWSFR